MGLPGFTAEHSLPHQSMMTYGGTNHQTAGASVILQQDEMYAGGLNAWTGVAQRECRSWAYYCEPDRRQLVDVHWENGRLVWEYKTVKGECHRRCVQYY
jgi:hypothetical protein